MITTSLRNIELGVKPLSAAPGDAAKPSRTDSVAIRQNPNIECSPTTSSSSQMAAHNSMRAMASVCVDGITASRQCRRVPHGHMRPSVKSLHGPAGGRGLNHRDLSVRYRIGLHARIFFPQPQLSSINPEPKNSKVRVKTTGCSSGSALNALISGIYFHRGVNARPVRKIVAKFGVGG
jgi:hypothetical protein